MLAMVELLINTPRLSKDKRLMGVLINQKERSLSQQNTTTNVVQ